jgi:type VI secretion system secreted protein Hcp
MASQIFIKIAEIKGESQDKKHKDEIEALAWSWGVSQAGSSHTGAGGGTGKADFSDFHFTHHVDKASPNLFKSCAKGVHLKEAKLTVRKSGKGQQEFLVITMQDVMITSVAPAENGDDAGLVENVALQFAKVDLEYKPQKADGSLDAGIHFKWDIKANKEG